MAVLSLLVSYERARAESLGLNGKGGLMERAERMMVLGLGLTFGYLTIALWLLVVLTGMTVVQRFLLVWRQATPGSGALPPQLVGHRPRRPDRRVPAGLVAPRQPAARGAVPPGQLAALRPAPGRRGRPALVVAVRGRPGRPASVRTSAASGAGPAPDP